MWIVIPMFFSRFLLGERLTLRLFRRRFTKPDEKDFIDEIIEPATRAFRFP